MSILGIVLGIAVVIAVYIWVRRMDRNYYKRQQEAINQRLARREEREMQEQSKNDDG